MKKAEQLFKDLLNENLGYVDLKPITKMEATPKTSYEIKFAKFLAEETKKAKEDEAVKSDSKKVSKTVEEIEDHNFDYKDQKNLDNQIGQEVMNGVYFEAKQNPDKTISQIKEIVSKNLAKDRQYYMKNAAFGVEGIGYQETELEEVTGKYASSGYSEKLKVVKESLMGESTLEAAELAIKSSQESAGIEEEARPDYPDVDGDGDTTEPMAKAAKDKKAKKPKKETIDTKLAEIGKEAEEVKMEAQLDFLHDHIQEKVDRVSSIQEDENLSELIDKTKMKQMQ